MISKILLLIIFIFSVCNRINGQTTWMYPVNHQNYNGLNFSPLHDDVCGIIDLDISPDSSLYFLARTASGGEKGIYRYDLAADSVAMYLGLTSLLSYKEIISNVRATPDSGFIFGSSSWLTGGPGQFHTSIKKYTKNASQEWSVYMDIINPTGGHWTNHVMPNNAGNYFALVYSQFPTDTLYEINNLGIVIDSLPLPWSGHGYRALFQMPNNDLLMEQNTQLVRMDLSGNTIWTFPGSFNLLSFDSSSIFVCDTGNSFSIIKKINPLAGSLVWTDTISQINISSIDGTSDGGVIMSVGVEPLSGFSAAPAQMDGQLIKTDANGNMQWTKTYTFNEYGLSFVKEISPGNYITSGTYYVSDIDNPQMCSSNAFIATVDSAGNSILEAASYMWPGDANDNDTLFAPEDILYTVMASGKSGPVRNTPLDWWPIWHFSSYAFDWSSSFANGVNVKHADFDNSGMIDTADVNMYMAYPQLWYLNELYPLRTPEQTFSTQPDFILQPENDTVDPGDVMRFYVIAGSTSLPVDSVFGIAFLALYDYLNTDMNQPVVTISNSDFGIPGTNMSGAGLGMGEFRMVFCRTDSTNVYQLHDTLAVIELTANSGITSPTSFSFQFFSFYSMTLSTSKVGFNLVSNPVMIDPALVNIKENTLNNEINIFPNPVKHKIKIQSSTLEIEKIEIRNVMGEVIVHKALADIKNAETDLSNLENGMYFLKVYTNKKTEDIKFIVNH
ncbi:MAG TPA: T9SS type A sorting domain-containing protein [Bacteroidia bacterium]|nr:T9SS type A sorting domain-containing protein [Bacteroidia bacterium]